ncbi:MAG TPA: glycosyl hydrolase [Thermoanaerobaculia bacterium]|nr:glycosyl hydrolase [Thermoanaerobaculia bacterium]
MRRIGFVILATLFAVNLLAAPPVTESTESRKVAAWLRALPALPSDSSHFGVLGGVSVISIGPQTGRVHDYGPTALYDDPQALSAAQGELKRHIDDYLTVLATGGIHHFRDVQNLPWGMIEISPGRFRYDLSDTIVANLQRIGGVYVGVIMPYAGWELVAAGYPKTSNPMCVRLLSEDFYYLNVDGRMDRYRDLRAYDRYLENLVERYDGDGIDDMPGLTTPVRYWQIHNEPEGENCGLFRYDVPGFYDLMRRSAEIIHRSCAGCRMLNGGLAFPLDRESEPIGGATFWSDFVRLGGATTVDVIAIHYNQGKDPNHGSIDQFEHQVRRSRELLGNKPVWVTEFGVVIGNGTNFSGLPEHDAAAWFMRFYTVGLANGVEKFFSDAQVFVDPSFTITLPFYVNKLIESKLGSFDTAEKITDGQYRFRSGSKWTYVSWNGIPSSLSGSVRVTDLYGNETLTTTTSTSTLPTTDSPLFLEPLSRRHSVRR